MTSCSCLSSCGLSDEHVRSLEQFHAGRICGEIVLHYSNGTVVESHVKVTIRSDRKATIALAELEELVSAGDLAKLKDLVAKRRAGTSRPADVK